MALPKTLKFCSIANCCLGEDEDVGRTSCLEATFKDLGGGDGDAVTVSIGDLIEAGGATADSSGGEGSSGTTGSEGSREVAPPPESSGCNLKNLMVPVVVGVLGWSMLG